MGWTMLTLLQLLHTWPLSLIHMDMATTLERERLRLNQRLNSMDMDIILVTAILDMVMLDILTPPPTMERERLRLNQRLNFMDMDIILVTAILDMVILDILTQPTMERERLRLNQRLNQRLNSMDMDIILDMVMLDILTQPTMDKHALIQRYLTNSVSIMLNLNLGC